MNANLKHTTSATAPKSGEALPAAGQSVSADESSPAPCADVGSHSAPSAAVPLSAAPSYEGAESVTVGVDPSKALTIPERARLALKSEQTERDLLAMVEQSKGVTTITNAAGRQQAHGMLMGYVRARSLLDERDEQARKELKALNHGIIDEKKRLAGLIAPEEKRIRELRDAWDKKLEDEKNAKAEAEQRRKDAIEARIEEIRNRASEAIGKPSADIAALIEQTTAIAIDDTFAEFKSKAESVQKMTLDKLRYFHQNALAAEQRALELAEQETRVAAERAELARQKAAEEVRQAQERERIAEEQRAARKAAEAEAARQAEQLRRLEAQRLEQEAEAKRIQEQRNVRIQEISAIYHQLAIAEVGRAPYCAGGDVKSYDWVIEQTEKWPVDVDTFGDIAEDARRTKVAVLAELKARRVVIAEKEQARAEEEAAAKAEADRLAAEKAAQAAEAQRLADERAELERQQEAMRLAREAVVAPTDPAEATDGELLSSATLFGNVASAELLPEPDAPSVDEAIITTLDALASAYSLDDVRGKELIVRMGVRVTELTA